MIIKQWSLNSAKDNAKSTRHVKRRLKSVRKLRNSRVITMAYIQTDKNLADPFTKGLSRNVIEITSREMGMRPMWVCSSSNPTFLIGDPVTKDLGKINYWQTEESIRSQTMSRLLCLMNPVLYLLSSTRTHSCYFHHNRWRLGWWLS
jgi:hypothetical protein